MKSKKTHLHKAKSFGFDVSLIFIPAPHIKVEAASQEEACRKLRLFFEDKEEVSGVYYETLESFNFKVHSVRKYLKNPFELNQMCNEIDGTGLTIENQFGYIARNYNYGNDQKLPFKDDTIAARDFWFDDGDTKEIVTQSISS